MADIVNLNEEWQGHSGAEVQAFLKQAIAHAQATANEKVGYVEYSGGLISFYTDETKATKVGEVVLSGNIYTVEITASEQSTFNVLSSETSKIITFSAASTISTIGGTPSPFVEDYTYVVSVDNGTGEFKEKQTGSLRSGSTASVNIRSWLTTGENRLRISVTGNESRQQSTKIFTVNVTTLTLESSYHWERPWIEGEAYTLDGIRFSGNLQKTLFIAVDGVENVIAQVTFPSGTNYVSTSYSFDLTDYFPENLEASGIHTLHLWMEGGGVSTAVFTYNVMCVIASEKNTTNLIVINDAKPKSTNYVSEELFKYAVYNVTSATFNTEVSDGTSSVTGTQTYSGLQTRTKYAYSSLIEFETDEVEGVTLEIEAVAGTASVDLEFPVDNSKAYLPTTGATFYMNAASRNNGSADRELFINQAKDAEVEQYEGTWTGFSFGTSDGWTTDGENNLALAVKAGCHISMPDIKPLGYTAETQSVAIEFKFKSENIADYDSPVMTFGQTVDNKQRGIYLYPTKLVVLADSAQNEVLQRIGLEEGEIHHIVIVLQRNYGGVSGRNLCSIYMNGCRNIHFSYDGTATFGDGNLEIGQASTDFYLYMMRFYEKSLESGDVLANFINTIVDGDEFTRAGVSKDNDILDGGVVDYEMAKKAGYNIMVVETNDTIPSIEHTSEGTCALHMWYGSDNDTRNFSVTNCRLSGQGTTSMQYYRWNLRFRTKDASAWTYGNGSQATGKKGWFDGRNVHPQVVDIVAKKNYASAMQGHKMGSVNLYDDLYKKILGTSALPEGARVAVYQYPVLGFQKFSDGTYSYIGLYTVGPHKGDKGTFGYDSSTYPMLMSLEGPNHAPLGTRFLHAWQDVDYNYQEETLTFGGEEGWDADFAGGLDTSASGNKSTILAMYNSEWKPAYEIVFFCSPYLKAFSDLSSDYNTLVKINAAVDTFRQGTTDGLKNSLLQIYDSSNYKLYAYNNATTTYVEVTGHAMLTYLEDYLDGVASPTTAQLVEARRQKFATEASDYWATDSLLFHYCFCVLIGATDNFAKNMYPFKFKSLNDGGRWSFRQDDLDSILDTDNNGQQTKKYSCLPGDVTGDGVQIYQGSDSALYALVETAFATSINNMMYRVVNAAAEIAGDRGISGSKLHETMLNIFTAYYWGNSARYFPQEAYNKDTEWSYIAPWLANPNRQYNNVLPLTQARGDAMYSEREWVKKHIAFIFSRYMLGGFSGSSQEYGQLAFTTTQPYQFGLKPAIDLYPVSSLGGQATQAARTEEGQVCTVTLGSTGDTTLYILGADWYSELGDLKGLVLTNRGGDTSAGVDLTISGKRLRKIKVGDGTASSVAFNSASVLLSGSPALEEFDARNTTSITATVDLTRCTRLRKALLAGSTAPGLLLPMGAQLTDLSLPDNLSTLFLHSLPTVTNDSEDTDHVQLGITSALKAKIASVYVNNCPLIDPIQLLIDLWTDANSALTYLTLIWDYELHGDEDYFHALYYIAQNKAYVSGSGSSIVTTDRTYGYVSYEDGEISTSAGTPVIEGTVIVDGYVSATEYQVVTAKWPNLHIQCSGKIIDFEDQAVKTICVNNWGGVTGGSTGIAGKAGEITMEQAAAVSSVGTVFKGNTSITKFNELYFFEKAALPSNCFQGCTALTEATVPKNLTSLPVNAAFRNCSSLRTLYFGEGFTTLPYSSMEQCTNLALILPTTFTTITSAFYSGSGYILVIKAMTPPNSAEGNRVVKYYVPDDAVAIYKSAPNWVSVANLIFPISQYEGSIVSPVW